MGFLEHFRSRSQSQDQQTSLLPTEAATPVIDKSEPSRKLAHHQLHDEITTRGGTSRTHAIVNETANRDILGTSSENLYEGLNLPKGQRDRLPSEAKEALFVGDVAARDRIIDDDAQGHNQVVRAAKRGYSEAGKLFRWNRK